MLCDAACQNNCGTYEHSRASVEAISPPYTSCSILQNDSLDHMKINGLWNHSWLTECNGQATWCDGTSGCKLQGQKLDSRSGVGDRCHLAFLKWNKVLPRPPPFIWCFTVNQRECLDHMNIIKRVLVKIVDCCQISLANSYSTKTKEGTSDNEHVSADQPQSVPGLNWCKIVV